jgi:hypothetical protein
MAERIIDDQLLASMLKVADATTQWPNTPGSWGSCRSQRPRHLGERRHGRGEGKNCGSGQ